MAQALRFAEENSAAAAAANSIKDHWVSSAAGADFAAEKERARTLKQLVGDYGARRQTLFPNKGFGTNTLWRPDPTFELAAKSALDAVRGTELAADIAARYGVIDALVGPLARRDCAVRGLGGGGLGRSACDPHEGA